jgi:ribose transport system permease protein
MNRGIGTNEQRKAPVVFVRRILQNRAITLLITTVVVCVLFSFILGSRFASFPNLAAVLLGLSAIGMLTVGMMGLLITGVFDLSAGSIFSMGMIAASYLMIYKGVAYPIAIFLSLVLCMILGFVNGFIITKMKVNALVATLATAGVFRGFAIIIGGEGINGFPVEYNRLGQTVVLGLQAPVWYFIVVVVVFSLLFSKFRFFRQYYFVGGNEKAAIFSGINVTKVKTVGYIISGGLAGLAGIIQSARLGASIGMAGVGLEMQAITAAVVGGASLNGGKGDIIGGVMGAVFIAVIFNIMVIAGVSAYWQDIVNGVILIFAVYSETLIKERSK